MADLENNPAQLSEALNNGTDGTDAGEATGPVRDEEKYKQARDAGWVAPQAYDYNAAQAKHGDVVPPSIEQVDVEDVPEWMHKAVKYEW